MRQYVKRGSLTPFDAGEVLEGLMDTVSTIESVGIYQRALAISNDQQLCDTYDAVYLAVSESPGCEFWTADGRFFRSVGARFKQVRLVGEPQRK